MKTKLLSVLLVSALSVFAKSPYEEYREKTAKYEMPVISNANYIVMISGLSAVEYRGLPSAQRSEVNKRATKVYEEFLNNNKLPFVEGNDELYRVSGRKFLWLVLNDQYGYVYYNLGKNVVMRDLMALTDNLLVKVKMQLDETPENIPLTAFYIELNSFNESLKLYGTKAFDSNNKKIIVDFIQKHLIN